MKVFIGHLSRLILAKFSADEIKKLLQEQPTQKVSRLVWFLYEWVNQLEIDWTVDSKARYAPILDESLYFVVNPQRLKRYKLDNNLIMSGQLIFTIRKTKKILSFQGKKLSHKVEALISQYDSKVLERATQFLYTKRDKVFFSNRERASRETKRNTFLSRLCKRPSRSHLMPRA